jgi:hypothetical protein
MSYISYEPSPIATICHRVLCFFGRHDWVPGGLTGEQCWWCYKWRQGVCPPNLEDIE